MVLSVDVAVVYGWWRKVASVAARGSSNNSDSLSFNAEDVTTLASFYFNLFTPNYAPATLLLDMFYKGYLYRYFYLTNADLTIECFEVTERYYTVDLGKPPRRWHILPFPHFSYNMYYSEEKASISLYYFENITQTVIPTLLPISSLV